jgi:hypothetical protein
MIQDAPEGGRPWGRPLQRLARLALEPFRVQLATHTGASRYRSPSITTHSAPPSVLRRWWSVTWKLFFTCAADAPGQTARPICSRLRPAGWRARKTSSSFGLA